MATETVMTNATSHGIVLETPANSTERLLPIDTIIESLATLAQQQRLARHQLAVAVLCYAAAKSPGAARPYLDLVPGEHGPTSLTVARAVHIATNRQRPCLVYRSTSCGSYILDAGPYVQDAVNLAMKFRAQAILKAINKVESSYLRWSYNLISICLTHGIEEAIRVTAAYKQLSVSEYISVIRNIYEPAIGYRIIAR